MEGFRLWLVLWTLCLLELTAGRTITHHQTITKPNGDKITRSWTTNDSGEEDPFDPSDLGGYDGSFTGAFFAEPSDPDEMLRKAARAKGMDSSAVDELLRTRGPVVRVRLDKDGRKHTTTYKLDPSGTGISSRTMIEIPAVVRTTYGMPRKPAKPKTTTTPEDDPWPEFEEIFGSDDDGKDKDGNDDDNTAKESKPTKPTKAESAWEWAPKTTRTDVHRRPFESLPATPWQTTGPKTYFHTKPQTQTLGSPFDTDPWLDMGDPFTEPKTTVRPTSTTTTTKRTLSTPTHFGPTYAAAPSTTHTRTATLWPTPETQPTVRLPETWQWKPSLRKPPVDPFNWDDLGSDPFDFDETKQEEPEIPPNPPIDEEAPEAPTTPKWTSKTIRHPTMPKILPDLLTTSTTPMTTTTTTTSTSTTTARPKHVLTFEPPPAALDADVKPFKAINIDELPAIEKTLSPHEKPIKAINIDDLPATEFQMGKIPIDFLDTVPDLVPSAAGGDQPKTKFVKIENIPMSEDVPPLDVSKNPPKDASTATAMLPHLNPEVREILQRGGITEDDIKASNGGPIVKTRVDPDGKTIRTTYRVRKVPTVVQQRPSLGQDDHDMGPSFLHRPPVVTPRSRIEEFLSKLGMGVDDILSSSGQKVTKTIVDDDGRILTATFLLSTVKNDAVGSAGHSGSSQQHRQRKPIK